MRKRRKTSILLGTALLVALSVFMPALCLQPHRVELEFGMFAGSNWGVANANSYVIIDKAIARFESRHPHVTIRYDSGVLKEDYAEWFSRKLMRGDPPDVFMVLSSDFYRFSSLGVVKNLDVLIEADPGFDREAFFKSGLAVGQYGGGQYALPYEIVPTLMFVNRTLLLRNGIRVPSEDWTWSDLYEICKRITKDDDGESGTSNQYGTYNYGWRDVLATNGFSPFNADGTEAYFTDERVVEAISFCKKIYDLNHGHKVTQTDFDDGRIAFMPLTFAEFRTYKTYPYKIKKYSNFLWDCITLPAGERGSNASQVDALLMGISSQTHHEKLAWEFLKLLTYDPEIQMDIFRYSQGTSVLKDVTNSKEVEAILRDEIEAGIIDNKLLSRVIEEGVIAPRFQQYDEAIALADSEINKILESNISIIDRTLKLVQRSVAKYLAVK